MDEDERRDALEDAGLDPDDYDDEFQVDVKQLRENQFCYMCKKWVYL